MAKSKKFILLFYLLTLFAVSGIARAEIIISGINDLYNNFDNINANISLQKQISMGGYLEVHLDCGERILVHKKYYRVNENQKKEINIDFPASLTGKCQLESLFGQEKKNSKEFLVSNVINIEYGLNNLIFFPLERVVINGTAKKESGEPLNGFILASLKGAENKTVEVKDGLFFVVFDLKKDAPMGFYSFFIEAFEKNALEEIINYGKKTGRIEIKRKPSFIKIDSGDSVKPAFNFSANISLLDQAGEVMNNETIIVKLFSPDGSIVLNRGIISGEIFAYTFLDNSSRLNRWELRAYYGDILSEKFIWIEPNMKIFTELVVNENGSYLLIKNIGNMEYNGTVLFSAYSDDYQDAYEIPVGLGLGKETKHLLNLSGNFTLRVGEQNFTNVNLITAYAVSAPPKISLISYLYILALFIFFAAAYFLFKRIKKIRAKRKNAAKGKEKGNLLIGEGEKAFMIFMRFDKYNDEIREIAEKENRSITKLSDNLYYILFYSNSSSNAEISSFSLARKIRNKTMSKGREVSIAINSGSFKDKEKFLKEFSLLTRKMVDHANGGILVCEDIFLKNRINAQKSVVFNLNGNKYKMYLV